MGAFQKRWGIKCCLNCQNRHPACHDACEVYQQEKAEYEEKKNQINGAKKSIRGFDNHHFNVVMHQIKVNSNKGR